MWKLTIDCNMPEEEGDDEERIDALAADVLMGEGFEDITIMMDEGFEDITIRITKENV